MKKLLILITLLSASAHSRAGFDWYINGGIVRAGWKEKNTLAEYQVHAKQPKQRVEYGAQNATGSVIGTGIEYHFGKRFISYGVRAAADYTRYDFQLNYRLTRPYDGVTTETYTLENRTLNSSLSFMAGHFSDSTLSVIVAAGPLYSYQFPNGNSTRYIDSYTGAVATVSVGYKGVFLNAGYTYGIGSRNGDNENSYQNRSRNMNFTLSVYPLTLIKNIRK